MPDAADFAALPLDDQLKWLEDALQRRVEPRELLQICAAVRDHAPLAWLARRLLDQGWLRGQPEQEWMAQFLLEQPETAVDRVLKALIGDGTFGAHRGPPLRETLLAILRRVSVDRVSVMCLVDRALKHNFVEARDAHVSALTERCADALGRGATDEVGIDQLAQVSTPGIATLRQRAREHGEATAEQLEQTLRALARRTLEVLGHAPKAVSQANAEELLSKRVYTDPGHFLVELLQNAEDAGARCFRLVFMPTRIVLWHDGQPFDTRDVVGVTSIGQTTKRKQQIGFFGVGFKSVYEVTDRPRIYSDVYQFEIADVSIPKALSSRPDDVPADGTVLVLPLRDPKDEERSPAALFAKARDLDAIVLFTLRRIDVIELELHDAAGTVTRHAVHEMPPDARGVSRIRQQPEGWVRGYAVHDAEHVYAGGLRAPGRADRTRVMVGLRVDEGVPRALEEDTPTIYSYLPTEEHSGLRFFVQGHFDVPVDRERITQDSRWNEWILSKVPEGLAVLARQLLDQPDPELRTRAAEGLLCVLPLLPELGSPIFRRIVARLRPAFEALEVVPCCDGSLRPPGQTVIAEDALASLLGGEPIETKDGVRHLVAPTLGDRAREVARALGSEPYRVADLVGDLERGLTPVPDGAGVERAEGPRFLQPPHPARFAACYEVLDDAVMRRVDGGPRRLSDLSTMRRLRQLPLVLSEDGRLFRPGPAIVRADPEMRSIYAGLRAFVHPQLDAAVDPEDATRATATTFLDRLGVQTLGVRTLVEDLEAELGSMTEPLVELGATRLPGTEARLHAALMVLVDAPTPLQRRVARLPVFRAQDGRYHRAAADPSDRGGVLLFEGGPLADRLLAYYGGARPVCAPSEDDPALALLRSARTPTLSVESLVADLRARADSLSLEELDRVHALIEALRDELPERTRRELGQLPLWPDTQGVLRPLRGPGAVLLPSSPAIAALFPRVPFLHPSVLARAHARDMGGEELGLEGLVEALRPESVAPRRIEPTTETVSAVLEILRSERESITPRLRAHLAEVPAFLDDAGRPCRLEALSLAEDPRLRAVYGGWPGRRFVGLDSPTRAAITELDLEGRLARATIETLAMDLSGLSEQLDGARLSDDPLPLVGRGEDLLVLLRMCAERAQALPRAVLRRLGRAPIGPDQHGRLGPLGDRRVMNEPAGVFACAPELRPIFEAMGARIMAPEAQDAIGGLLEAGGYDRLTVVELVERLSSLGAVATGQPRAVAQTDALLGRIQAVLIAGAPVLAHRFPPRTREDGSSRSPELSALAIWPTRAGGVIAADEAVDGAALDALLPSGTPARARLDSRTLEAEASMRMQQLAPLLEPMKAPDFAAALVRAEAVPDEPLSRQPPWLGTVEQVTRVAVFIGDRAQPCPLVDATGCLRLHALQVASADTVALLEGTPLAATVLHPAMRAGGLSTEGFEAVPPPAVLDAVTAERGEPEPVAQHPVLRDAGRRARLYAWIEAQESAIFTHAEARARLRTRPLFPTDRGTLRPADQLVIDPDLPELDVDWTPHPEIPEATLGLLVRHLGVGRPPVEDLVADHLAPAYHRAARQGDGPGAARLLEYLARALSAVSDREIRTLLGQAGPVLVEGAPGRFRPAAELLLPPAELAAASEAVFGSSHPPPHARVPQSTHGLLSALGIARLPPRGWVADAMRGGVASEAMATGLAMVVAHLFRDDPRATLAELPLEEVAWILDGRGMPRRPQELFAWTADVQALVGESPALYPSPAITRALGEALSDALGLRSAGDVRLTEVVAHIDASREAEVPLPFRVYQWLEEGLTASWLDADALREQLGDRAWVCSDDGEYHPHDRVLGVRALEFFGSRRGYWERGREHCPTLCRRFRIADRVTPTVLLAFLEEVADEAEARGDQVLLAEQPGLPRMLLRAYAALGRQDEPAPTRRLLCRQCGGDRADALGLRAPEDPLVMRSDAPVLEAMFSAVGCFFVAAPGPLDDRAEIDQYYDSCGVRRLRESYEVRVAPGSEDMTRAFVEAIGPLRASLVGLVGVLPRVRLQRTHLSVDAWVYEARLAPLARTGRIQARAGLEVDYVLPGVGEARTRAVAVYDPGPGALLVDTRVFSDPDANITGLAQGLMPCIYDGPSEEQLVDIVEILLRLGDRARMDAYLDQRFFPTAAEADPGLSGSLATRVGELFDYGLDRRLQLRFEALRGRPLERWRAPSLFAELPAEAEPAVRTVVARLLAAIELSEGGQALEEALALLLSAPSLSDVPAGLLAPEASPAPEVPDARPSSRETRRDASETSETSETSDAGEYDDDPLLDLPSLEELDQRLAELVARRNDESGDGGHPPFVIPSMESPPSRGGGSPSSGAVPPWLEGLEGVEGGSSPEPPLDAEPEASRGFWGRLARRLGFDDEPGVSEAPPPWAAPGANVLSPAGYVGPQLWVRGRTLREMATERVPMGLLHQPPVLPSPYRYVVHTLGGAFQPATQQWHPTPLPSMPAQLEGEPTGATVAFAGTLAPGRSVLPTPLYGDIVRLEVVAGDPSGVRPMGRMPGGGAVVEVSGRSSVRVRYEVGLRHPPTLAEGRVRMPEAMQPTLARSALPAPVRQWIERNASSERGAWELARRAEAFVQRHYVYDLEFRERPEVERAVRQLRAGVGNHHLEVLHASADPHALGRGVCYELNVLVVELLRHLGVPSLVAIGWMLDEGFADRPDHLFALAVVPSAMGPCLLPLDASTGPRGPVRPLAGAQPPAVDLTPEARPAVGDVSGGWGTPVLPGPERDVAVDEHVHTMHRSLRGALDRERETLRRAIRVADVARGRGTTPLDPREDVEALRRRAAGALGDPRLLPALLAVIRGEFELSARVPEPVQALIREGLAVVESEPAYRVRPADVLRSE